MYRRVHTPPTDCCTLGDNILTRPNVSRGVAYLCVVCNTWRTRQLFTLRHDFVSWLSRFSNGCLVLLVATTCLCFPPGMVWRGPRGCCRSSVPPLRPMPVSCHPGESRFYNASHGGRTVGCSEKGLFCEGAACCAQPQRGGGLSLCGVREVFCGEAQLRIVRMTYCCILERVTSNSRVQLSCKTSGRCDSLFAERCKSRMPIVRTKIQASKTLFFLLSLLTYRQHRKSV